MRTPKVQGTGNLKTKLAALCAVGLTVSACGMRDPRFTLLGASQGFLSAGVVNNKVDILWVIDNSGTMGPKQTNLKNSISSFMTKFAEKQMDYQIAVVTTDTRTIAAGGQEACFVSAGANPKIVTPSTPNAATVVGENAEVGFFGIASAKAIDAVKMALDSPNVTGCNAGFLRDGAFLAVIPFSDADDNDSVTTVAGLMNFLDTIKVPTTTPSGGTVRSYFSSAIVVEDLTRAECIALGPFSEVGAKFINFAGLTGGIVASICDADFSSGLLSVSTKILEATTAVRLNRNPDVSTISVFLNGVSISRSSTNGWSYDSSTNSIIFHGSAIPVGAGVAIVINFTPTDVVR